MCSKSALNETASVLKKRQEIGRGLRLAVNQDGERIQGFEVNTLTVMANEAYDGFVRLQKEMEDEDLHFGTVLEHQFANITQTNLDGTTSYLGEKESQKLYDHLKDAGHVDKKGKVQDGLRLALKDKTLNCQRAEASRRSHLCEPEARRRQLERGSPRKTAQRSS